MADPRTRSGLAYALAAYAAWGFLPLFWRRLHAVPPLELVAHRVVWSFVFVAALLASTGRLGALRAALGQRRAVLAMVASSVLITGNWFLFVWAVSAGHVLSASLGYYINPLFNVVVGRVVLGERLRPAQLAAVVLAALAVLNLAVALGSLPWVSLVLASSFAAYGLVKKTAPVESMVGLAIETSVMTLPALGLLLFASTGGLFPALPPLERALLLSAGAATALPLLAFGAAARRLRYSTLGITQYVSPTLQFFCAVALFHEPFSRAHAVTFGLIWVAVVVYAVDAARAR